MTRDDAWALLTEWTTNPNLLKHMLAVEAAMRAYARKFGGDEDEWGLVGLLHDMDYERYPSLEPGHHPYVGVAELRRRGVPEAWTRAILSHADYTGVARETPMEKTLAAVDELTGFIIAVALVKGRSLDNVGVDSVKKKFKDKAFAKGVHREEIFKTADDLGVPLDDHIAFVIEALKPVARDFGLA